MALAAQTPATRYEAPFGASKYHVNDYSMTLFMGP